MLLILPLCSQKNGTLCYIVNGKEGRLYRGESMMSPAGDRHTVSPPTLLSALQHPSDGFWSGSSGAFPARMKTWMCR